MIDVTCFSTERWETTILLATPAFEKPCASSPSTSCSRGVSSDRAEVSCRRPSIQRTTSGSSTEPPAATRLTASANSSMSEMRSLSR